MIGGSRITANNFEVQEMPMRKKESRKNLFILQVFNPEFTGYIMLINFVLAGPGFSTWEHQFFSSGIRHSDACEENRTEPAHA